MKIDFAVYTAQEGYRWQPSTRIDLAEILAYKKGIGKFPSADDEPLPFGGILLDNDRGMVVFYRFHVAKKIDFCGRDALYCVLGRVPKAEAVRIDPKALFALPEFSAPMTPFPVEAEIAEADVALVPEWLADLEHMAFLDVRITGTIDDPVYAVTQEMAKPPEPVRSGPEGGKDNDNAETAKPDEVAGGKSYKGLALWALAVILVAAMTMGLIWYLNKGRKGTSGSGGETSPGITNQVQQVQPAKADPKAVGEGKSE